MSRELLAIRDRGSARAARQGAGLECCSHSVRVLGFAPFEFAGDVGAGVRGLRAVGPRRVVGARCGRRVRRGAGRGCGVRRWRWGPRRRSWRCLGRGSTSGLARRRRRATGAARRGAGLERGADAVRVLRLAALELPGDVRAVVRRARTVAPGGVVDTRAAAAATFGGERDFRRLTLRRCWEGYGRVLKLLVGTGSRAIRAVLHAARVEPSSWRELVFCRSDTSAARLRCLLRLR